MKTFKRAAIAAAITTGLAMTSGQVFAAAMGTGNLAIDNLLFQYDDGTGAETILVGTDIIPTPGSGGLRNNGDTQAVLNGVSTTQTGDEPASAGGFDVDGAGFSCIGPDCAYVDDSFVHLTAGSDAGTYVVSDVLISGAAIDFPGATATTGADADVLAESAVYPDNVGSAQGNVGVTAELQFIAQTNGDFVFTFDYDAYLRAALTAAEQAGSADASVGWSLSLVDVTGSVVYDYNLSDDDEWVIDGISTSIPGTDRVFDFNGTAGATFAGALVTGNEYVLTVDHFAEANSNAVPAPAPLALIGLGLLGFGLFQAKRKQV